MKSATHESVVVHYKATSGNGKTGHIPVTVTSAAHCPPYCEQWDGCYAKYGPVSWHWRKVSNGERGYSWGELCADIAALPEGQLWRHNVSGDLLRIGFKIDAKALRQLVKANQGKRGFTYTHHNPAAGDNASLIREANAAGFTVNLSANNLPHADKLKALGIAPVAVVLPPTVSGETTPKLSTPGGNVVVVCPATYRDKISCETCKLCAVVDRKVIVGFPAHGAGKGKAKHAAN
jgi:hypothetical protein